MKRDHATPQAGHCTCQKAGHVTVTKGRLVASAVIATVVLQLYTLWAIARLGHQSNRDIDSESNEPLIMVVPVKKEGSPVAKEDITESVGMSPKEAV